MRTVRAFVELLQDYRPIQEIVLLGDILDLQLANWAQAIEGRIHTGPGKRSVGFRYFLTYLLKETGTLSVVYVPGNHDYRIFDYHSIEKHLMNPLRAGKKLQGRMSFFRTFTDPFLQGMLTKTGARIKIVYPHYVLRVNGRRLLLTHGHFFDPTQAFHHEVGKIFSGENLTRKDIQRVRSTYMRRVAMYQNLVSGFSMQRGLREWFTSLYQPFTALKIKIGHRTRKTFLTPAMKKSIGNYITYCCRGKFAGVIFGHTHHAGYSALPDGPVPHVWNAGTFLREAENGRRGSFLTIRTETKTDLTEAIRIHHLD